MRIYSEQTIYYLNTVEIVTLSFKVYIFNYNKNSKSGNIYEKMLFYNAISIKAF